MDVTPILLMFIALFMALIVLLFYMSGTLKRTYRSEVKKANDRVSAMQRPAIDESDIAHMPEPVQKYLRHAGVIGKERVLSFRAVFEGEMKNDPKMAWNKAKVEQWNFYDTPTRLFYMKMNMFGLPFSGLHSYMGAMARMHIKALGLFTVLDSKGSEMRMSDTVTLLNDMCFLAPATLVDKRLQWEPVDSLTAKVTYENAGCKVSARLFFNEKGELIDFISEDRYVIGMDNVPHKGVWATPATDYGVFNGVKLATSLQAIWLKPEGNYCYGKFMLKEIEYNPTLIIK